MSELNETAGEQGNVAADGSAQSSSVSSAEQSAALPDTSSQSGGSEADAGKPAAADGTAGDATAADGSNAPEGEQGNAAAGESQSSQSCLDSGESTLGGELPNGAGMEPAGDAIDVAGEPETPALGPLTQRVEAAALRAYQSGNTSEHNLMAWLHTHLTGAKAAAAGADKLEGLTPEAQSILADLKNLL
jgi:hypothetical protein